MTAQEAIRLLSPFGANLREIQAKAEGRDQEGLQAAVLQLPEEISIAAIRLLAKLHADSLSSLLCSCFAVESYINALGYHLLRERDFIGLFRSGHDSTAQLIVSAIERMSTLEKWETIGKLRPGRSFDRTRSPFQDLKVLFNFRNDLVHDKVVEYSRMREKTRYNGKLPDPVLSHLSLRHALFAADTYWSMVQEIHLLLDYSPAEFQRHYNLSPWFSATKRDEMTKMAIEMSRLHM